MKENDFIKWHEAIKKRRSRRQFIEKPIESGKINYLVEYCQQLNNWLGGGARAVVVTDNPEQAFKGLMGSYGKIKGAPAYVAFIGDSNDLNYQEKAGYLGEAFILEATNFGLASCWIGGFFKPEVVAEQIEIMPHEEVLAITPIGYVKKEYTFEEKLMAGFATTHKRKDLKELCQGLAESQWPKWVQFALEAARLAPSAVNRQPWRFTIEQNAIKVSIDNFKNISNISKRLDCGIAMLHLEAGAIAAGVTGTWTYLESKDVAVYCVR
ncbi:MAG: nitroreductase family protein [Bacillota bacterium]|nr:nitroreductase family protein [Bacillota bacterium]